MKYFSALILAIVALNIYSEDKAQQAFQNNQYDLAKSLYHKQLEQPEKKNNALIYLARIAINENKLDDAEDYLNQSIKIEPNDADEYYWYGVMSGQQASNASIFSAGSYASDAKDYFQRAIQLNPTHIRALRGLTQFYIQAPGIVGGSEKKALQMIEKIKKISPVEGDLFELSLIEWEDNPEQALTKAAQMETAYPESARALYAAGMIFQRLEKYSQAMLALKNASEIISEDKNETLDTHKALYQLGRTTVLSKEDYNEGILAFKNYLLREVPNNAPSKQWAKYALSVLYERTSNNNLAKELLLELQQENIESSTLKERLSDAYKKHNIQS